MKIEELIALYANQVKQGQTKIEDVPEQIRERVSELISNDSQS